MSTNSPSYGQVDRDYGMRLATTLPDEDGPVWMVNLMKYREVAQYADGRASTISGREADDLYAPLGPLAKVGAEGFYCAGIPSMQIGVALKVEDGAKRAAEPALLAVLRQIDAIGAIEFDRLATYATPEILNTRDEVVGRLRVVLQI